MQHTVITIIGLGGVGGYFGYKLAKTFRSYDHIFIDFVARGETYEKVKSAGLSLLTPEFSPEPIYPREVFRLDEIPNSDIYVIAVKEYDLDDVCQKLCGKITDETIILPLMNGVDIVDRIRATIKKGFVIPSCVYVASHIREKGTIEHKGNPGKIIIGRDPLRRSLGNIPFLQLFEKANIDIVFAEDVDKDIWTKFIFIASVGLVSARHNKSIGQVIKDEHLRRLASSIMTEIHELARKKGIGLDSDIIDKTFQKAASFPFDTPTSLQLDTQSGNRKNELELFAGTILKFGRQLNISTPATHLLNEEIKSMS